MCARTPEDILPTERSKVSEECGCERGPFKQPLKSVFASILTVAHYIQVLTVSSGFDSAGRKITRIWSDRNWPREC